MDTILPPILIFITALVIIGFIFNKVKANRDKLNTLSTAKHKSEEFVEKCTADLAPILNHFYGEKSNHYLKTFQKQNILFCNQIISLIIEYKPNISDKLVAALATLNEAYVNSFYEASQQTFNPSANQQNLVFSLDDEVKHTIAMIAKLCHQELDESLLIDSYSAQKQVLGFKDRIEAVFLENQSQSEELSQYMDLIEQLREEKREMRQTIGQLLGLLESIYNKYQKNLKLEKNISFEKADDETFRCAFKLDNLTTSISEKK